MNRYSKCCLAVVFAAVSLPVGIVADDASLPKADSAAPEPSPAQKAIRQLAEDCRVQVTDDSPESGRDAALRAEPIITYGDATRSIGESALWVWFDRDQPVLFEKIEVNNWSATYPQWTFCFSSFAESPLSVKHPVEIGGTAVETTTAVFSAVPDTPKPGKSPVTWPLQAREFSRALLVEVYVGKKRSELRLLPKPLLEFRSSETGVAYGGVFGIATGTNPDVLVQFRLRQRADGELEWVYAVAPMTSGRVVVSYKGTPIAEPPLQSSGEVSTWGYFFARRTGAIK